MSMSWDHNGWHDVGGGVQIVGYTQGGVPGPAGLLERHACVDGYQHVGMLPYDRGQGGPVWRVLAEDPTTIAPSVLCRQCGLHGWIRDGQWMPA